mmetsp:Transcript_147/g.325  ORF Transcript_147/g.325 Transcript_147/m.325 type:complete len:266 (+) Transcript_147:111-908(+)|eukprot:CAMPEP_0197650968 /NCGR_PEP_ID=MMETSP1338-20131121/31268_1 /TAXON_ID=43686 ORGANISM="Pelagodinium beii, Strain RCC1491" /NCGR_SAMPLE_ID=MMETSP1338 /ASSEMBLY_ACC=CAM_ASM_000754 /LENGTH=265 /DNA_ID=CAMNT_0043225493 /DNA_START=100 /DNA_END=897 /DNA_ORIENTATION=-
MSPSQILALALFMTIASAEKRRAMPAQTPQAQPKKEAPQIIDSRVRMSTPRDEASRVSHLRQHVVELNSVLFAGNALQSMGGGSEQWVVAFCPSWWEPCNQLDAFLAEIGAASQDLNSDFTAKVRFAKVDCAKEKVLCNQENVETYPTIAHYKDGRQTRRKSLSTKKMQAHLKSFVGESLMEKEKLEAPASTTTYLQPGGLCDAAVLLVALALGLYLAKSGPDLQRSDSRVRESKPQAKATTAQQEPDMGRVPQEWAQGRTTMNL